MKPAKEYVILSVNEDAAYKTESGIFIRADLGSSFENMIQYGYVEVAPSESGLNIGDKVYFCHILKDDGHQNYNYDIPEVKHKAYVIEKGTKDSRTGWDRWIFATEKDGELIPYRNQSICLPIKRKHELFKYEENEPNLVEVVSSNLFSGVVIKAEDGDLDVEGMPYQFIHKDHILGTYKDGVAEPVDGQTFIKPLDESDYQLHGKIWIQSKYTAPKGYGEVISSTHPELKSGDKVVHFKTSFKRIEIGDNTFYSTQNDKIIAKL